MAINKHLIVLFKELRIWQNMKPWRGHFRTMASRSFRDEAGKLGGGAVELTKDDNSGIATLILNNPEKKNSLTGKMMLDFEDCVSELEQWKAGKAVILAGAGKSFCSGGELSTVDAIMHRAGDMCEYMQGVTSRLFHLPMVSVAAISGHALGGGAELTTACDFRLMTTTAKVGFVQVKLNVTTGWGGGTRLVKLIGRTNALHLMTSGMIFDAEYAMKIGFASGIIDKNIDIVESAKDWLNKNVISDTTSTRIVKQVVVTADNDSEEIAYSREKEMFSTVFGSKAHIEAMKASTKFKE